MVLGSGKTTIALLKAQKRSCTLEPRQEILFLGFYLAAVQQILMRCKDIPYPVRAQAYTDQNVPSLLLGNAHHPWASLGGRQVSFLYPGEERLRKSVFEGEWDEERVRLSTEERLYCFDFVAPATATLLDKSAAVRTLFG